MDRTRLIKRILLLLTVFLLPVSAILAQEELTLERVIEKTLKSNPELALDEPVRAALEAQFHHPGGLH